MENVLMDGIMAMPIGWKIWVFWLMVINTASLGFIKRMEARIAFGAFAANAVFMTLLAEWTGFTRLLGLSHCIFWTPLLVYLFIRRKELDLSTLFGKWVIILVATNFASLLIDYADVIRYALGDRG